MVWFLPVNVVTVGLTALAQISGNITVSFFIAITTTLRGALGFEPMPLGGAGDTEERFIPSEDAADEISISSPLHMQNPEGGRVAAPGSWIWILMSRRIQSSSAPMSFG